MSGLRTDEAAADALAHRFLLLGCRIGWTARRSAQPGGARGDEPRANPIGRDKGSLRVASPAVIPPDAGDTANPRRPCGTPPDRAEAKAAFHPDQQPQGDTAMNEITIHGNLTANPVLNTNPTTGRSALTFDVALNSGYYDRGAGQWRDRAPVYHRIVCFGELASNAAQTLRKGMTVTVTGTFADDSYTPNGADRPIRRTRIEATDVAVSLRWAVAAVARQTTPADQRTQTAQTTTDPDTQPAGEPTGEPNSAEQDPATEPAPTSRRSRRTQPEPAAA